METLASFMESLTKEKDKLVNMGTIIKSKDQDIFSGVSKKSYSNKKYLKQKEKEKKESSSKISSSTDGSLRSRRRRNKRVIPTCDYYIGSHL